MKQARFKTILLSALVLGGVASSVGCGSPAQRAPKKTCKALKECNRTDFDTTYSSMKDCVDDFKDSQAELEDYVGQSCSDAFFTFLTCISKQQLKDCSVSETALRNQCEDDLEKIVDDCPYDIGQLFSDDYYNY